ncbi:hypothetical protein [Thermoproteus tenax]|nr:hypothetical protein [Thermoproteus tenax]
MNPLFWLGLISVLIGVVPLSFVKRSWRVLLVAGAAYFSAIIIKAIVQLSFLSFFLTPQTATYLAYGLLTAITEPGMALLFARFVREYPGTYGVSLAFWENAVLLGISEVIAGLLFNLTALPPSLASMLASTPFLFLASVKIIDRTSSLLLHYSWGVSAYHSYWRKDVKYILITAPFGMVDSLAAYVQLTKANLLTASIPALMLSIAAFVIARTISK